MLVYLFSNALLSGNKISGSNEVGVAQAKRFESFEVSSYSAFSQKHDRQRPDLLSISLSSQHSSSHILLKRVPL